MLTWLPYNALCMLHQKLNFRKQCFLRLTCAHLKFLPISDFSKSSDWDIFQNHVLKQFHYTHEVLQKGILQDNQSEADAMVLMSAFQELPYHAKRKVCKEMKIVLQTISILLRFDVRQKFLKIVTSP